MAICCVSFISLGKFGCPMYKHLISLPVNTRLNFTINNFDAGMQKLGGIDLNNEIYILVITVKRC